MKNKDIFPAPYK